eukprot:1963472-Prymnesium_polylepis.2
MLTSLRRKNTDGARGRRLGRWPMVAPGGGVGRYAARLHSRAMSSTNALDFRFGDPATSAGTAATSGALHVRGAASVAASRSASTARAGAAPTRTRYARLRARV